ncbi:MAG TPA: hypothetical protein ENK44_14805 [Caldithrix abyssi]|uniref:Uncharacterized protein n=1 Tax=Caldithrix abyssi TaxID=187145 RepID=A0A7V4U2T1_CALAY|nr:hypothetical protein [Caldithrix abyssi]
MHEISKALEVWTLQTLLNISILLGLLALGLALIQPYYRSLREHLTLRVSVELWDIFTVFLVDFFLAVVVLVGFVVLNPDIMADIKVAVPFGPLATVLFAIALVVRLFYNGHRPENKNFPASLWLMFAANLINIFGFSFVMEAASGEYLQQHPSAFWTFIKTYLRSNANPHGLELAQITFYVCFPLLIAVFIWGFVQAMKHYKPMKDEL